MPALARRRRHAHDAVDGSAGHPAHSRRAPHVGDPNRAPDRTSVGTLRDRRRAGLTPDCAYRYPAGADPRHDHRRGCGRRARRRDQRLDALCGGDCDRVRHCHYAAGDADARARMASRSRRCRHHRLFERHGGRCHAAVDPDHSIGPAARRRFLAARYRRLGGCRLGHRRRVFSGEPARKPGKIQSRLYRYRRTLVAGMEESRGVARRLCFRLQQLAVLWRQRVSRRLPGKRRTIAHTWLRARRTERRAAHRPDYFDLDGQAAATASLAFPAVRTRDARRIPRLAHFSVAGGDRLVHQPDRYLYGDHHDSDLGAAGTACAAGRRAPNRGWHVHHQLHMRDRNSDDLRRAVGSDR